MGVIGIKTCHVARAADVLTRDRVDAWRNVLPEDEVRGVHPGLLDELEATGDV